LHVKRAIGPLKVDKDCDFTTSDFNAVIVHLCRPILPAGS